MNRITSLSIFLAFVYGILMIVFKMMGYTIAAIFAQPSQFYLLVFPLGLILFIFQMTLIIMLKGKGWRYWLFKSLSLAFTLVTIPMIVAMPWTYIQFGTNLQIFISCLIGVLLVCQITSLWINKKAAK